MHDGFSDKGAHSAE
jgi:hypothetical protein